jgi:hypothetical protein
MALIDKRFKGGLTIEKASNRASGLRLKTDAAETLYTLAVPATAPGPFEIELPDLGTLVLSDKNTIGSIENKSFEADSTFVQDTANSKLANFALSQANASAHTFTLPQLTDTLVARTSTDTLTNKSISALTNTLTDIANASISASAAIAYSKLNLTASIVNADIASAAGIELDKLEAITADRALISNSLGFVTTSTVTNTELAQLSGITGNVQTQLDSKATDASLLAHTSASSGVHGVTGSVVGTTDAQILTNKDIDTGLASNTRRLTVGKQTKTNLDALTRKEATLVFGTDTKQLYVDDGTSLLAVGGSWTPSATQTLTSGGTISISTTIGLQYVRVQGDQLNTPLSLTPFGSVVVPDGTVIRLVGQNNNQTVFIGNNDASKGVLLNGSAFLGFGDVLELQYDASLDRYLETFRNF